MPAARSPSLAATAPLPPVRPGATGWLLLLLCWMLVVIGPLISAVLLAVQLRVLLAPGAFATWLVAAGGLSALLTGWAVLRGLRAGLLLWRLRPGAVEHAKSALLLGLAAEIVDTLVGVAMAGTAPGRVIGAALLQVMPGLVFFVLAFGYLQHSASLPAARIGGDAT